MKVNYLFTELPETRQEINLLTASIIELAQSGEIDILDLEISLKSLQDAIETARKSDQFKDELGSYVDRFEKEFDRGPAKITRVQKSTYYFDNNESWVKASDKLKQLEKTLKTIPSDMADSETGEILHPAYKRTSEYLKIIIS